MIILILNIIIFINLFLIVNCINFPESPCPEIFSYQKIRSKTTSYLKIDNFNKDIQNVLKVKCSNLGNPRLAYAYDNDRSTQDLLHNRPIIFELSFQLSNHFPEIIEIVSNGITICQNRNNVYLDSNGITIKIHKMGPITWSVESEDKAPIYSYTPIKPPSGTPTSIISQTCGIQTITKQLVLGDKKVAEASMPWLAVIFSKIIKNYLCTGNLLSKRTILTAAHCFSDSQNVLNYIIGLGVYDLGKRNEEGAEYNNIQDIIINPNYKKFSLASYADIALVIITNNIEYTTKIMPICLWSGSDYNSIIGTNAIVPGWGRSDKKRFNIPRLAEAKIVSNDECLNSNIKFHNAISNTSFCAGFRNGQGPCSGDSGSGLVFKSNGLWYVGGIVSRSLIDSITSTCDLNEFILYTDVSKFKNWIEQNMI